MTRYWTLVSDELAAREDLQLPDGLRFTLPDDIRVTVARRGCAPGCEPGILDSPVRLPGASWYQIEDDGAPPELEGQPVELVFRLDGARLVVADRRPAA